MTPDEEAVLALHQGWMDANRTGDCGWLRENLAPDYSMANTNGSFYRSSEHLQQLWEYYRKQYGGWGIVEGPPATCESRDVELRVVGDVGWVSYRIRFAGESTGGDGPGDFGEGFDVQARGTDVMERRDGRWVIVHGHYSIGEAGAPAGGV